VDSVKVDLADAMHDLTLNVTVVRSPRFKIRMWIGLRLIRLAAFVMGVGQVSVKEE
jgi:hypothetical protein